MARWGRCDYRELKKLDERLQQLSEVDMDRLCRDAAKKVAQILLNKVKKRTPVGVVPSYATDEAKQEYWAGYSGGSLRDAWTILPIEKHGDQYTWNMRPMWNTATGKRRGAMFPPWVRP